MGMLSAAAHRRVDDQRRPETKVQVHSRATFAHYCVQQGPHVQGRRDSASIRTRRFLGVSRGSLHGLCKIIDLLLQLTSFILNFFVLMTENHEKRARLRGRSGQTVLDSVQIRRRANSKALDQWQENKQVLHHRVRIN